MAATISLNSSLFGLDPKWHPYFDRQDFNLESHQLLWLDSKLSELEDEDKILDTLTKFRQLINYTKAFDHWRYCLKHIEKSNDTCTFLVCSNRITADIIPQLQPFTQTNVWKIYVYGENETFLTKTVEIVGQNKVSISRKIFP